MAAKVTYTGFFAWAKDLNLAVGQINELARANLYVQVDRFMKDRNGFSIRFSQSAYETLRLTHRCPSTVKAKMMRFGRDLPYVSTKKAPLGGMHLRDLLKIPGTGYNITTTSAKQVARMTLTLPGAKKLNQLSPNGKHPCPNADAYRRELIGFYAGARWQATTILTKALDQFKAELILTAQNAPRRQAG